MVKSISIFFTFCYFFLKLFERKCVLYMLCLFLIDSSIPLVIQGLLHCFCLLWDICFLGACLLTIRWRVLMDLAAIHLGHCFRCKYYSRQLFWYPVGIVLNQIACSLYNISEIFVFFSDISTIKRVGRWSEISIAAIPDTIWLVLLVSTRKNSSLMLIFLKKEFVINNLNENKWDFVEGLYFFLQCHSYSCNWRKEINHL